MAITKSTLLNDIANELQDYGSFEVSAGSFLERCLLDAMDDVDKASQWDHRIAQDTITTTSGTRTGYAVPADFAGLAVEEKQNKFWAYDAYSVPPPIADGAQGRRYPISYNRVANTIEFFEDPGDGDKTFTYLTRVTALTDLDNWPDHVWLKKALRFRTCFYALAKTDDVANQAKGFYDLSEKLLDDEKINQRKGRSQPDTRTLLDINGNPMYYSFVGDL